MVFSFLAFIDQIPPITFFIPLLLLYLLWVYFLIKGKFFFYLFLTIFVLAFFSFLGDLFYVKLIKTEYLTKFINKYTPLKLKEEELKDINLKKLIYSRLSPLYKIFIYENNREQFFKLKNMVFLYLSHVFFFSLVALVAFISIKSAELIGFKRFDLVFTFLSFFILTRILKI